MPQKVSVLNATQPSKSQGSSPAELQSKLRGATLTNGLSSLLGIGPRTREKQCPVGLPDGAKLQGGQTECYKQGQRKHYGKDVHQNF